MFVAGCETRLARCFEAGGDGGQAGYQIGRGAFRCVVEGRLCGLRDGVEGFVEAVEGGADAGIGGPHVLLCFCIVFYELQVLAAPGWLVSDGKTRWSSVCGLVFVLRGC